MEPLPSFPGSSEIAIPTVVPFSEDEGLQRAAREFASFFDATADRIYPFLLHASGSCELAVDLLEGVYFEAARLSRRVFLRRKLTPVFLLEVAVDSVRSLGPVDTSTDTVDYAYLDLVFAQSRVLSDLKPANRADRKRQVLHMLSALHALPWEQQALLIAGVILGWSLPEITPLVGGGEGAVANQLQKAADSLRDGYRQREPEGDILPTTLFDRLRCAPQLVSEDRQRIRLSVVEHFHKLRSTQVSIFLLLGTLAVVANTLVSGVIVFAVVSDPLSEIQERSRPQVAAIDASVLQREIASVERRIALEGVRRKTDAIALRQEIKDVIGAYGLKVVREALLHSPTLAHLPESVRRHRVDSLLAAVLGEGFTPGLPPQQ